MSQPARQLSLAAHGSTDQPSHTFLDVTLSADGYEASWLTLELANELAAKTCFKELQVSTQEKRLALPYLDPLYFR